MLINLQIVNEVWKFAQVFSKGYIFEKSKE